MNRDSDDFKVTGGLRPARHLRVACFFATVGMACMSSNSVGQTSRPALPGGQLNVPFTTEVERCIVPASNFHGLNPWLLRAVLKIESSLQAGRIGRNSNGTFDVGIGQINSIHLKDLQKHGIEPVHLTDACVGTYASGWLLKKAITRHGYTWEGVASYHSTTPQHNLRYQKLLIEEIRRSQVAGARNYLMPTPMGSAQAQARNYSGQAQARAPEQEPDMVVFELAR